MDLKPMASNRTDYLRSTDILDWTAPPVNALARSLASEDGNILVTARQCFEWVRDRIRHSVDFQMNPVTCSASEVLRFETGFCYAKSHLLVALLRANRIPAGLCYQRLRLDPECFCLHGLVAVWLEDGEWYRCDPRGNKPGIEAAFHPPVEQLAFPLNEPGECDYPEIWPDPLACVVDLLRDFKTWEIALKNLPDMPTTTIPSSD
jgi:transglutaminase-like putative cysteine protease